METTHSPRTRLSLTAMILLLVGWSAWVLVRPSAGTVAEAVAASAPQAAESFEQITLTAEQQELVDFALGRFARQGLELPEVAFRFHTDIRECRGHKGFYVPRTETVHMCSLDERTMLHELAHAWSRHNLTEDRRREFMEYRDLPTWNDHHHPWEERATEHAAEIMAWALLEDPNHVPLLEAGPDGEARTVHRLLTIGDSEVETMLEAFRWLTGRDPIFRSPSEWQEKPPQSSPEAQRVGSAEQP